MSNEYDVTVTLEVIDAAATIAAGRQWLIDAGVAGDFETAAEIITDGDVEQALRYLIDPGTNIPGVQVIDSFCQQLVFEGIAT